jgi:hypothetical protein
MKGLPQIGKCPLCLNDNANLHKSHFIPAAAFKIIRAQAIREGYKNPNPVVMNIRAAFQSSMQMTADLLCHSCEQRLSANGEAWVLKNCWRGETFLLKSTIESETPERDEEEVRIYWTSKLPAIDRSALTYFAASVFWRASAHNWWGKRHKSPLKLGPYAEQLRQYLMGISGFPKDCAIVLVLPDTDVEAMKMVQFIPSARRFANCHLYILHFLGIQFLLFAGKMFPEEYREMDFVHGNGNPILVTSRFERWMRLDLVRGLGNKRLSKIARNIDF